MENRRQTGADYEERAARWLKERGYRILERNYRCRQGEIDLVAMDGGCLVFVEVKYRKDKRAGHPAEAVDLRKQRRIGQAAAQYCCERRTVAVQECRFDVICILGGETEHYKNAFELQGGGSWSGSKNHRGMPCVW